MKLSKLWMVLLATLMLAGTSFANGRIKGAELIVEGDDFQVAVGKLMGLPFDQAEVDLMLANFDKVEAWAKANKDEWKSVDGAEDPIKAIRALGVWATVDIKAEEFLAIFIKVSVAKDIEAGNLNADELVQQKGFIESMMADMPAEQKAEMKKTLDMIDSMANAIKNYDAATLECYKKNKDKLTAALERFEALSEDEE